jgi:hypothetical protein
VYCWVYHSLVPTTNRIPKCWIFNLGYNGFKLFETPAGLFKVVCPDETIETPATIQEAFALVGLEYRGATNS